MAPKDFWRNPLRRADGWKLTLGPGENMTLYHLARYPHEDTNLASEHPEKVQHLISLLQKEALTE